jgi:Protein of unknown function (DUF2844)
MKAVGKMALSCVVAVLLIGLIAHSASASLGGDASSADADMAALKGQLSQPSESVISQPAAYSIKQFVTARGTTVREFSAPSGPIFGIAWEGRRTPDLTVLLGSYYSEYAKAAASRNHFSLHHAVFQGADMTVVITGHMGQLKGRAFVPNLTPSDVDPQSVVR